MAGTVGLTQPQQAGIELDDTDPVQVDIVEVLGTGLSKANPVIVGDNWEFVLESDEAVDDSDKTITVPADSVYQVLWIWVEFTSTVTVGDRQVVVQILDDAADLIAEFRAGQVQAASLTRYYMFAPALADLLGFRDTDYLMTPLPPTLFVAPDYDIRIYDNNAVDAAADDMIIQMMVAEKSYP